MLNKARNPERYLYLYYKVQDLSSKSLQNVSLLFIEIEVFDYWHLNWHLNLTNIKCIYCFAKLLPTFLCSNTFLFQFPAHIIPKIFFVNNVKNSLML